MGPTPSGYALHPAQPTDALRRLCQSSQLDVNRGGGGGDGDLRRLVRGGSSLQVLRGDARVLRQHGAELLPCDGLLLDQGLGDAVDRLAVIADLAQRNLIRLERGEGEAM